MTNKRDLVLKKKQPNRTPLFIIGGFFVVFVVFGLLTFNDGKPTATKLPFATQLNPVNYQGKTINQTPIQSVVANGTIRIPLQQVEENKFIITSYQQGSKSVALTSYIAPSGKVISAISICEPCRSQSFHIQGDQLVCNACGTRWDLETLRGLSGGCQDFPPDTLESTLADGQILIAESLVANWQPRV